MHTYKHILITTLIIAFPTAIMGMENDTFDYADAIAAIEIGRQKEKTMERLLSEQANLITQFAKKNSEQNSYDSEDIRNLGLWLNQQRNKLNDAYWNSLILKITKKIDDDNDNYYGVERYIREDIIGILWSTVGNLKPGEDCTERLVDRAEKKAQQLRKRHCNQKTKHHGLT